MTDRRPFELVIFDCDGVLVDSERLSVRIDVAYLDRLGWPMDEAEVIERFVGRSDADIRADIELRLGGPIPAEVEEEFGRLYRETFERELVAVDGITEVLDALAARATRTCVASSGEHVRIRTSLALTGLASYFDERIFSAEDVAHGKPAPDLFLHAAEVMGVGAAACAVIEDSVHGVEAARAAGMRAFAYAGGVTRADRLAGPGTIVFDDMRALPDLLAAGH